VYRAGKFAYACTLEKAARRPPRGDAGDKSIVSESLADGNQNMDAHTLKCLDFDRICEILGGFAMTSLGRGLATNIRPVARVDLVRRWLNQVDEMGRLEEQRGLPPFGGITDVREIVERCAPPLRVSVEEVARVGDALRGTRAVAQYLSELPEDFPELRHLAERIGDFGTIADRIGASIDERARMRDDASPKLARIRREIDNAARRIKETVEQLLRDPAARRLLQFPNYTFHNDRLVLPLRTECRGRLPGIIHHASDSGATLYVEPAAAVELNNEISNLRSEEAEEIARLLWELAHEVYINATPILKTLDTLAVLDLVVAKVRWAGEFAMRCPEINEQGTLHVRQARHPLLLDLARQKREAGHTPDEVVPIDYRLGEDFNLLVVTGPNTGGKTVALKTVGLLNLMVQAGLPVPVDPGANMAVFKHALIDVGDEQSMQQSLSTFSAHLTRQMQMLRAAGPRTLVLIDELGAGTDPDEGAAIGRAILDELLRLDCRCIVTTHIGALKGFALTRRRAENGCVEFDSETLKPTYHLRIGEPGVSNAIAIAGRLGMPRRLIVAAKRNLSRKSRALHAALVGTTVAKRQAEDARQAAETARLAADRAQNEADSAKARLAKEQAGFQEWVQRVVHLQPGDPVRVRDFDRDGHIVRMRLEQQRAEVDVGPFAVEVPLGDVLPPQAPPPPPRPRPKPAAVSPKPTAAVRPARRARQREAHPAQRSQPRRQPRPKPALPSVTPEQAAALQPGDTVVVKRFHRDGTLVRTIPTKQVAVVTVGLLEVEVPFDGLALPPKSGPTPAAPKAPSGPSAPAPPTAQQDAPPPTDSTAAAQPPPDA